jgi:membrane-associated protein
LVILLAIAGAILGNTVGYCTDRKLGTTLLNNDSFQFFRKRAKEAYVFIEKQGPQSLVLARFLPAMRCFALYR